MPFGRNRVFFLVCLIVFGVAGGLIHLGEQPVMAAAPDCLTCHEELSKGKTVHAAVQMGCPTCHSGIDATDIPHKKTNKVPKGLSAEQPDLCYGCHDKAKFSGKSIHAPVGIGSCTGCHSPHASAQEKLLIKKVPDLCYDCHEKKDFTRKNVHMPVAGGMCLGCHKPHVAEEMALLKQEAVSLCFECHPQVRKIPHAVSGFSTSGHPIGLPLKKKKPATDPARPGKKFYCGSCHNPHSSDWMKLFRYKANVDFEICDNCHKM
jgi:predicted CXXCH cytochrome family protein